MSKVKVKKVTKKVIRITLTEEEAQALSDLLSKGVAYGTLEEIKLGPLNSQLVELFPDIAFEFDGFAKLQS